MMPPICVICHKDFRSSDGGELLSFPLTEAEKEENKVFEQPGFVGHPAGLHWFCAEHVTKAKALQHLTSREAIGIINKEYAGAMLCKAAKKGNLELAKQAVSMGADLEVPNDDFLKERPLHLAAMSGHLAIVRYLVEQGADTNARAGADFTPLHLAVRDGHTAVVEYLAQDKKLTMRVLSDVYTVATMSRSSNPTIVQLIAQARERVSKEE